MRTGYRWILAHAKGKLLGMTFRVLPALALLGLMACGPRSVPPTAPQASIPETGTLCAWAIYNVVDQVGKRCFPGQDREFQAMAAESAERLDRVLREKGGMTEAELAKFKRDQTGAELPDAEFCKKEGGAGFYLPMRSQKLDELRREVDKVVTRPGEPVWGDCI